MNFVLFGIAEAQRRVSLEPPKIEKGMAIFMTFQIGAALLECCVLAVLCQGDAYGYSLTQNIREAVDISESTLYPVLRRLQKDGCLTTYDQPYQGRNRRYYAITSAGRERYNTYYMEWKEYKQRVDSVLSVGKEGGEGL